MVRRGSTRHRTGSSARTRRAQSGEAANVIIRGVDEVEAGREAMGVTRLHWEGPWLVSAEVELANRQAGERARTGRSGDGEADRPFARSIGDAGVDRTPCDVQVGGGGQRRPAGR